MKRIGLAVSLVLILAACGDDGGATTTTPDAPGGPVTVTVVLDDDFSFTPETMTVPAGATVTVNAQNMGGIEHSWVLLSAGPEVTTATDLDPGRILATMHVDSETTGTLSFTAPGAGLYQVICDVTGHLEAGMEGTLVVN